MRYIILISMITLSGCRWSVEEAEEVWDPRLIENAEEVCEQHGGIEFY